MQYRTLTADRAAMPIAIGDSVLDARLTRAMNVAVALVALLLLAPLMLLVALAIRLSGPGPVLFAHRRIGRGGMSFPCLKFRSMVTDSNERLARLLESDPAARLEWEATQKLRRDPRITWIGGFLRRTSTDELPQLFNVLRGEMSLVGPRPIVAAEAERFGRYFVDYCSTLPGITGLWQISGRSNLSYRRRVALDVAYARSRSIGLDIRILVMTLPAVLAARGSC